MSERQFVFGPFHLDLATQQLWRAEQPVHLRPRPLAVLHYLLERAGQVVSSEALLKDVWAGTYVGRAALKVCIRAIREALGDDAEEPRYVETIGRVGYRFIENVVSSQQEEKQKVNVSQDPALRTQPSVLVGRDAELAQLRHLLGKALDGERQIVFVTGEAGIGKTTVVDAFLRQARAGNWWVAQGQCLEQYGASEPYMPVLTALSHLCRGSGGERLTALLRQYAPTWLVQMPSLLNEAETADLQRKTQGATQERMLREMAEAIEVMTAERPLILWLEDLHWSDYSTLDLLSLLARRQTLVRLLVLGTYRPADVTVGGHPLRRLVQELMPRGLCQELPLEVLNEAHIAAYIAGRCGGEGEDGAAWRALVRSLHRRTDGHPLFLVNVVDHLLRQHVVETIAGQVTVRSSDEGLPIDVPANLRQMIAQQMERSPEDEQRVLAAASIVGVEFSAAAVASGVGEESERVEELCERLLRRGQFLQESGTERWPDGTLSARYRFRHALYQEVLYQRVSAARRMRLHQRIGERLEVAYGAQPDDIVAALATHFAESQDATRATRYLQLAAQRALCLNANREASDLLSRGITLLQTLPETVERNQQEVQMQITLGPALMAVKGFGAPEVGDVFVRARVLCQQMGESPQLFPVLAGLVAFYTARCQPGDLPIAQESAGQCLHVAETLQHPALLREAHRMLSMIFHTRGEFSQAQKHMEQAVPLYNVRSKRSREVLYILDPEVVCKGYAAWNLCLLGYPDQALILNNEAVALARQLAHALSIADALWTTALLHTYRRDWPAAQACADECLTVSIEHGLPLFLGYSIHMQGWTKAARGQVDEGIADMQHGLALLNRTGVTGVQATLRYALAETYAKAGRIEEGLQTCTDAIMVGTASGHALHVGECHRVKGELLLQQSRIQHLASVVKRRPKSKLSNVQHPASHTQAEAEACFLKALETARCQQARLFELRATMSLARLWRQQGKIAEARQMLMEMYNWFTEGFDTKDLQEAKALLQELT